MKGTGKTLNVESCEGVALFVERTERRRNEQDEEEEKEEKRE